MVWFAEVQVGGTKLTMLMKKSLGWTSKPRLMEPVFLVEIQTVEQQIGGVYSVLNKRRGIIIGEENRQGTPIYNVKSYLPVQESFGMFLEGSVQV